MKQQVNNGLFTPLAGIGIAFVIDIACNNRSYAIIITVILF